MVTQAHDDASLAQASVVPLPQRGALVIDADRFFSVGNNGAVLPSKAARRDMQALFIHARCHEMLKPLARALSLGVDEVERRIDQQIRGVNKTDPQAWAKVIDALRAGDEAGVVKAFIRPAVVQTLRTSPIMPRRLDSRGDGVSDGACQELLNVASDILTFEPPRMARSQQLRKLLAADAGRLALEGFINRNIAALRMLMAAYSTAVANDAIRRKLEVVVGDFDLLATQNVLLAFQDAGSMAAMRATVPGAEAGMLLREEPIHLGEQVARSYLSSESTAAPPAPDRRDQPIYLQLQIHPLTSDNLEYAFIVHELLHGYHDGGVVGASRAINKALGLATPEYGAKFLYEYVVDYLQWEITGKPPKTYAPRALSVRCVLVARTDLENRSYDQCEAAVLGLVFNPQPTWGHLELAALERLTRSLHAQHQIDKHSLSDPRQRVAQHIVGYPSHDKPVLEVTVLGRQGDGFLVKPKGSLPTPLPEGMTKIREGVFHVKAEKLASRVVGT
ncbi:MAG TPA: hypothetical protein VLJ86_11460 [Ramlibacter sp.]|nr:hypothetical protein [Ramlibacter sp.]